MTARYAKSRQPSARKGAKNRVPLNARIDEATAKQLANWRVKGVSRGVQIDRIAAYAPEPAGDWRATARKVFRLTELPVIWSTWLEVPADRRAQILSSHAN